MSFYAVFAGVKYDVRPVAQIPGYYADTLGGIWSNRRGIFQRLRANRSKYGYLRHNVVVDGKLKSLYAHVLILTAFVSERPSGMECCHINGNASDNRLCNLKWGTHKSNMRDRSLHGTCALQAANRKGTWWGEASHTALLSNEQAISLAGDFVNGMPQKELRKKYGVGEGVVAHLVNADSWSSITGFRKLPGGNTRTRDRLKDPKKFAALIGFSPGLS